ncbi:hypothetical protein SAMN02910339_01806 [Lachnospiraceae bacterium YSD2013]|nr:hypothetical protein SAMN02910339_01806 [Lachnospiraceae bacterium YSD2013]
MILTTLLVGLAGALLMFAGDMTLYYDKNDFKHDGTLNPIINIMRKLPPKRVMIGGWIGPVAAFLYCIGFYHMVLIADEPLYKIAFAAFLLSCMGIIAGGAYHSHCAYLGLLGADEQRKDLDIVTAYFQKLPLILYLGEGLGLLALIVFIVIGKTVFPRWMAILSPGVLYLLKPLSRKLPKGLHMILCGGFSNVVFIVYYVVAIIVYATML